MRKLLFGLAALPFITGAAFAAEKAPLSAKLISDVQMDQVTAGFDFIELDVKNTSTVLVAVNQPTQAACAACYLVIQTAWFPAAAVQPFQILAKFGP